MKITCIQMDVKLGDPAHNFEKAAQAVRRAMKDQPDVLVFPETWNTGFFPRENLEALCDRDGAGTKDLFSDLAKQYSVNIVAGSVSDLRGGRVYNTAMVFDREGACIASYDKTHLFTPMGEDRYYTPGTHLCTFTLDDVKCGIIICYDLRFPELTRTLALGGLDVLFLVSQWPVERISHLRSLCTARAIENQIFLVCCNGCGSAGSTRFGGNSAVYDPWGEPLALAGQAEQLLSAELCLEQIQKIRKTIHVFQDRRPELYDQKL